MWHRDLMKETAAKPESDPSSAVETMRRSTRSGRKQRFNSIANESIVELPHRAMSGARGRGL
jgi:hypothetical protein